MTSQNGIVAMLRAFLLSAEVPGVNVLLSPVELNDAAACCAFLIAFESVSHRADSILANDVDGALPNADAFSSAAINCCSSCILS